MEERNSEILWGFGSILYLLPTVASRIEIYLPIIKCLWTDWWTYFVDFSDSWTIHSLQNHPSNLPKLEFLSQVEERVRTVRWPPCDFLHLVQDDVCWLRGCVPIWRSRSRTQGKSQFSFWAYITFPIHPRTLYYLQAIWADLPSLVWLKRLQKINSSILWRTWSFLHILSNSILRS